MKDLIDIFKSEISHGFIAIDKDGTIIEINNITCDIFNLYYEDLMLKNFEDYISHEFLSGFNHIENITSHESNKFKINDIEFNIKSYEINKNKSSYYIVLFKAINDTENFYQNKINNIRSNIDYESELALSMAKDRTYYKIVINNDGEINYCSENLYCLLGYKSEELISKSVSDIICYIDIPKTILSMTDINMDTIIKNKNGEKIDINIYSGKSLSRENEKILIIKNTNDQKKYIDQIDKIKNDANLHLNKSKFNCILDNIIDGVWEWPDINADYQYWSPQWKKIIGYKEHEISASTSKFFELIHPDDKSIVTDELKKSINSGHMFKPEYRLQTKSGEYKWFSSKAIVNKSIHNNKIGLIGSISDINELKTTSIQLEEYKFFQKLVLDSNPNFIFVKDEDYKIIMANKAFLKLYPDDMQDNIIGFTTLEKYSFEDAKVFLVMDKKAFDEGYSEIVETLTMPNKKNMILFTQKIRFYNEQGEKFILGVSNDITERESLISNLSTSNEDLERFAYIASHDLQEPARMIHNFSELLKDEHSDKLDEEGLQYLNFINESSIRMKLLIKDILDYSRLEHEKEDYTHIKCEVILTNVTDILQKIIQQSNAVVTHSELPEITFIPIRMSRLFQNIISNAIRYAKKDEDPKIHIEYIKEDLYWTFSITDNGIGMEEKYFQNIFTPFKRLHSYDEYKGTGIGLSICKRIIDDAQGKIWLESKLGKGTTFFFSIPKHIKNEMNK